MAEILFAAPLWSCAVAASMLASYVFAWRALPPETGKVLFLFGVGGFFAFPLSLWLTRIFQPKAKSAVFALIFLMLSFSTIGFSAVIFALDFWFYFSQWHAETFSKIWALQFFFTFGSAIYQFLVSGLRLYLPFGLVALLVTSLWVSKRIAR